MGLPGRVTLVPGGVPVGALGAALAARKHVIRRLDARAPLGTAPFEVLEAM